MKRWDFCLGVRWFGLYALKRLFGDRLLVNMNDIPSHRDGVA
jgi:hypothetical protein